ncbi:hypothetical protein I317_01126 [Kwoniella heveanensis CBS 569]|nr:hypothetical protein I317_01126 [Kwoniella heveanensis CBS 569]
MVFHITDFTDSEPEEEAGSAVGAGDGASERGHEQDEPMDAESDLDPLAGAGSGSVGTTPAAGNDSRAGSEDPQGGTVEPKKKKKKANKPKGSGGGGGVDGQAHPLRITLRPSINHLMQSDEKSSSSGSKPTKAKAKKPTAQPPKSKPKQQDKDRSSLSPPPPITLKLGFKHALAEKAAYSSSEEDDDDEPRPTPPPSKKKKVSVAPASGGSASKGRAKPQQQQQQQPQSPVPGPSSVTGTPTAKGVASATSAPRKSYDWLAPSVAGASHRGPPERERAGSIGSAKITGWSPADEAIGGLLGEGAAEGTVEKKPAKRSHKKKVPDAGAGAGTGAASATATGPSKAAKKGAKKMMPIAPKVAEGEASPAGTPHMYATPSISRAGSPELLEMPPRTSVEPPSVFAPIPTAVPPVSAPPLRAPSPPFVLADAKTLGIPIFSKPIHPNKVLLGTFPKVTQYFAPINGGDVGPFPRKEKVRSWTHAEKVMVGIGGGQLKIKSWLGGPSSELGRLVQADKDAKEQLRLSKTKGAAATPTATPLDPTSASTPAPGQAATSQTQQGQTPQPERPPLTTANSFDMESASASINNTPVFGAVSVKTNGNGNADRADEDVSEIGGDDESVLGNDAAATSAPTAKAPAKPRSSSPAGGKSKSKAPRKSKLANEIVPTEVEDEEGQVQVQAPGSDIEAGAIVAS